MMLAILSHQKSNTVSPRSMIMKITQLSVLNVISDIQFGVLIALLITAIYWNSLQGSFIWDDRAAIVSDVFFQLIQFMRL